MNKTDLINEMVKKGIASATASALINPYSELPSFSYQTLLTSKTPGKYQSQFSSAYNNYGIYFIYITGTNDIMYIGEAAVEPFKARLVQHFNSSHGGLRYKKPNSISTLANCDVLILYGKYNSSQARDTHFDEDFLIGTFRPLLNDR